MVINATTTSNIASVASKYKNSAVGQGIYNTPAKNIVLPALLVGNMAYKLGTEKNPDKRTDTLINNLVSWGGGAALVNLHNKVLPYYLLPIAASAVALFQVASKDSPKEKADVAVNHGAWWAGGIGMQAFVSKVLGLSSPLQRLCGFAAGASILGPLVANLIKDKIIPNPGKLPTKIIENTLSPSYTVGNSSNTQFSPFSGEQKSTAQLAAMALEPKGKSTYKANGPYNLNSLIPGGLLK